MKIFIDDKLVRELIMKCVLISKSKRDMIQSLTKIHSKSQWCNTI
jgi:hypothetical protein